MNGYLELSADMPFLLVDDVASYREVLSHILKNLGFRKILHATGARVALNTLKAETVSFIICERALKNMSGIEFLKEIRETPDLQRIPFVMTANNITKEDVVLATEMGVDGYLKKPFIMGEVSVRLSSAMNRFLDPLNPEIQYDEAKSYLLEGNFEEAINAYDALLQDNSKSARALTGKARVYKEKGDLEQARDILIEAIGINPMYVHAHHLLGLINLQLGKVKEALINLHRAIEISPGNPIRYETICEILITDKDFAQAEAYLKKAVSLELAYPDLYAQLGKVMFSQKKSREAADYFEKALREQPNNTSFLNSMGICLKELGKFDEAMNYYNVALKLRPQDTKVLFNKSLLLISMKQKERALKTLTNILQIDPDYEKARKKIDELNSQA